MAEPDDLPLQYAETLHGKFFVKLRRNASDERWPYELAYMTRVIETQRIDSDGKTIHRVDFDPPVRFTDEELVRVMARLDHPGGLI